MPVAADSVHTVSGPVSAVPWLPPTDLSVPVAVAPALSPSVPTHTPYSVLTDCKDAQIGLNVVTVVPGSVVPLTGVAVCTAAVTRRAATVVVR